MLLQQLYVLSDESSHFLYSKQARRTGMAGPLGEMFDHGQYRFYGTINGSPY